MNTNTKDNNKTKKENNNMTRYDKLKKADLINQCVQLEAELNKTLKAVAQLTATKHYPTPSVSSTDYVNLDKLNAKTKAVSEKREQLPPTVKQISRFYGMLCAHRYPKFEMPHELTRSTLNDLMKFMETLNRVERKLPTEPVGVPKYSDAYQAYEAAKAAHYDPKAKACAKLCHLYPEHQYRFKIVFNSYKYPAEYTALDQQDQDAKAAYDAKYKIKAPSVVGEHRIQEDKVTVLYTETVYQTDWKWTLDNFR